MLKALEENNIEISAIGGTSSGSLIASLYAMGYTPSYIYGVFKKYSKEISYINSTRILGEIRNFIFNKPMKRNGIKDGEELEEVYNKLALRKGIKKISDIKMPLVIPTVDISKSKEYIFTSVKNVGNTISSPQNDQYISDITVGKAVWSSSSFPAIMRPCCYKDHIFSDGGILNNVPVEHVRNTGADTVMAVIFDSNKVDSKSNMMDIMMKTVDIMGNKISEENLQASDYVLTIPSDGTGLLETDKIDFCFSSGYDTTIKNIDKIKEILK